MAVEATMMGLFLLLAATLVVLLISSRIQQQDSPADDHRLFCDRYSDRSVMSAVVHI